MDSSIASCTKGIWVWGNYRKVVTKNAKVIFIDSEGTSSVDRSTRTYDSKIFALVVLISSLFIYNTNSNIDEQGISELALAAHLSSSIAVRTDIDKESLIKSLAPKFIWVIRDFTLEKQHPTTKEEISSDEYLELCLSKKIAGKNGNSSENNQIRESIMKYFPRRECITLPRPVETETELRELKTMPFKDLKSNFKLEFLELKKKVYTANPKCINCTKLTGSLLADLIVQFVDAINHGAVPNINNAWDSVVQNDIKDYYEKAINKYKSNVINIKDDLYEDETLVNMLTNAKFDSVSVYYNVRKISPEIFDNTNEEYSEWYKENEKKLLEEIKKIEDKKLNDNIEKNKKALAELIKKMFKDLSNKLFNNYYKLENIHYLSSDLVLALNNYLCNSKSKNVFSVKIMINYFLDNLRESLYYIVSTLSSENKKKLVDVEKHIAQTKFMTKEMDNSKTKLEEVNKMIQNKIIVLNHDNNKKAKEIEFLKLRLITLENELKSVKIQSQRLKNNSLNMSNNSKDMRIENLNSNGECGCNCMII